VLHIYRTGVQALQVYRDDLVTCAFHLDLPVPSDFSTLQAGWVVRLRRHGPEGNVDLAIRKAVGGQELVIMEPPQSDGLPAGKSTTLEKPMDLWGSSRAFRGFDRQEYYWKGKELFRGHKKVAKFSKTWFGSTQEKLGTLEIYSLGHNMIDLIVAGGVVLKEWEAAVIKKT